MGGTGSGGDTGLVKPSTGKVGVFVAAGHGARTITSCDDGLSWIENDQLADENVDHSEFTEKGLVYGDGVFLHMIGWGYPNSVKRSENGIDWTRHTIDDGGGGLVFLDTPSPKFQAVSGWGSCAQSMDGITWSACDGTPTYPENVREVQGGGSFVGVGGDLAAVFSFDAGVTWAGGAGCDLAGGFGNLGQRGGFAHGNGVDVAVASHGEWCQTPDGGVTWNTGDLDAEEESVDGKVAFLGGQFWAPTGNGAYRSTDGTEWQEVTFQPEGTRIHAMAWSQETGTYVGVERVGDDAPESRFYRSEDGVEWTLVTAPGGPTLRRVVFGFVDASETCPGE